MITTLRIGRRLRRAIGVTTGTVLVAGLSVVAGAPGALASGDDGSDSNETCASLGYTQVDKKSGSYDFGRLKATREKLEYYVDADWTVDLCVSDGEGEPVRAMATGDGALEVSSRVKHFGYRDAVYTDPASEEPSEEPSTDPTEPSTDPTEPSTEPTEPSTEPTEPSTEPTEPSTEPTEPSTEPTEPSTEPTEPSTEPTEPSTEPTEPSTEPTEPSTEPTEPSTEPTDPGTEPAAFCPGIDDDVDYRTLFDYEYYAAGDVLLGSTDDWNRQLSVEWLNRPVPAPISSMMVRAVVTLKDGVDITRGDCSYDFSLASYEAQGSTFSTSGQQVFIDHDTDTVTADDTSITLDVEPAECFGQSDLYKTDKVYDGDETPRGPGYAPINIDGNMIANWMGGTGCEPTDPGTEEPSEEPSEGPSEEPSEGPSEEPSEGPSETPTDPGTTEPSEPGTTEPTEPAAGDDLVFAAALATCDDESLLVGLALVNDSDADVPFAVVVDGEDEVVVVPGGTEEVSEYEVGLDEVLTVQVSVGGEVLVDESFDSGDCTDANDDTDPTATATTPAAGGPTTPGTQPRVLARTGAETWTIALVAALFLAAGGALVALGSNAPRGRRQA